MTPGSTQGTETRPHHGLAAPRFDTGGQARIRVTESPTVIVPAPQFAQCFCRSPSEDFLIKKVACRKGSRGDWHDGHLSLWHEVMPFTGCFWGSGALQAVTEERDQSNVLFKSQLGRSAVRVDY